MGGRKENKNVISQRSKDQKTSILIHIKIVIIFKTRCPLPISSYIQEFKNRF